MNLLSFLSDNWLILATIASGIIWSVRLEGKVKYQGKAIDALNHSNNTSSKDLSTIKETLATLVERTDWLAKYGDKFFNTKE